jgi:hypothetical protein
VTHQPLPKLLVNLVFSATSKEKWQYLLPHKGPLNCAFQPL